MARDGSGNYTRPIAAFVNGTTISSSDFNDMLDDMEDALSDSININGTKAFTANQPMGGQILTGLGAGLSAGHSVRYEQVQPIDAGLTAMAALTIALRTRITGSGSDTFTTDTTPTIMPQGRLTLTTAEPIMSSGSLTAQTTIYYTPHVGDCVPIWDGTQFISTVFTELSLALNSNSGHTGYHQSGKNFDLYIINDAGTVRLATGPAWSSDTVRGAGAGLELHQGVWVNNSTRTMRYGANSGDTVSVATRRGAYVGTFRASADGQTEWTPFPSSASGGSNNRLFLFNAYNRVPVNALERDSATVWNYTTATWRPYNGASSNVNNRISFVNGLLGMQVDARGHGGASNSSAGIVRCLGLALDSTTAPAGLFAGASGAANDVTPLVASYSGVVGIGFHYLQLLEYSVATGTTTWQGTGGTGIVQAGMIANLLM